MKKGLILGLILLIGIVAISGCTNTTEKNITLDELKSNATEVTIDELYNGNITNGTYVKLKAYVTGIADNKTGATVGQIIDYGNGITGIDSQNMIVVFGTIPDDLYDNDEVWIYGIFRGPMSYESAMGYHFTVPGIENGFFEKTGERYEL
jgi:hypothetical protein